MFEKLFLNYSSIHTRERPDASACRLELSLSATFIETVCELPETPETSIPFPASIFVSLSEIADVILLFNVVNADSTDVPAAIAPSPISAFVLISVAS